MTNAMNKHEDAMTQCCAECGKEGGASLKVCKSCMLVIDDSSGIATLIVREIIGRRIKSNANNVLPSYVTRLSSMTHRPRKTILHLLPTNASKINMLYITSTRDHNVSTHLRFCDCK